MMKNGRLRVMVLTDTFLPHAGGSRFYYYNLFKRIAGMGHEVTIATSKLQGWQEFDRREQTGTFKIQRHFIPLRDLSYSQLPKVAGPLLTALASSVFHRPDIIHCGDLYPAGLIGVILKRLLGLPFVAYCHGEDITLTDKRRFQPRLRDLIYRDADAVVANGDFAIENLLRIGIQRDKIHKITPGLDTSVFYPFAVDSGLRQHYNIETDELVVMTVARLVPRKGHARVMRALAALGSTVPPFKYVVVGRGSIEAELRDLANQLGLGDKVVFAGFVADDKLNQHYNLADVVAMPNTEEEGDIEGFGMVFLEANAAGKPVIGGRSGGTAEAVADGESGFLVDSDEELRDVLERLLTDSNLRQHMGSTGLQRARAEFDWDTRAALLGKISSDIAASKR
jgi:phosphatidylinositol alpha-1,6-mannosyltransferase